MRAAVPGLKSLCAVGCIILFAAAALWPSGAAYAAAVPKHLVPLTVDLLRGVKEKLKSASPKSGETDIRQRAYKILRQEGLYHWARRELIRPSRPMTPDTVPVIGRTRYANLILNTGHGTLGWTMACGSGRIVADLVSGRTPEIDLDGLGVERFG